MESRPIAVRVPVELLDKLDEAAKRNRRTRSNQIIVVIEEWLKGQTKSGSDDAGTSN